MDAMDRAMAMENNDSGEMKILCQHTSVILTKDCKQLLRLYDKWSAAYATIKKCSKLCNEVFGLQVSVMLALISLYYMILLYTLTTLEINNIQLTVGVKVMYGVALIEFLFALYALSKAAQSAQNSSNELRKKLGFMLINSVQCEKVHKATRDFLRLTVTHPIRTTAFGSIGINMALLPAVIGFCVSYTVIALQFNNVL